MNQYWHLLPTALKIIIEKQLALTSIFPFDIVDSMQDIVLKQSGAFNYNMFTLFQCLTDKNPG